MTSAALDVDDQRELSTAMLQIGHQLLCTARRLEGLAARSDDLAPADLAAFQRKVGRALVRLGSLFALAVPVQPEGCRAIGAALAAAALPMTPAELWAAPAEPAIPPRRGLAE